MLYIHTLKDLNPKSAEIESTPLIRELKRSNKLPLDEGKMNENLSIFFVSQTDLDAMTHALELIPTTIHDIVEISKTNKDAEPINLSRACAMLQEVSEPLKNNLDFSIQIFGWQTSFIPEITALLNRIPELRTQNEKIEYEMKISAIFEKMLRNNENFFFNSRGIVSEAELARLTHLSESMNEGFFFSVKLEEHLQKKGFNDISQRIPQEEINKVNAITQNVIEIKKGIERAYNNNMCMVNLAVILYSYIKWLRK